MKLRDKQRCEIVVVPTLFGFIPLISQQLLCTVTYFLMNNTVIYKLVVPSYKTADISIRCAFRTVAPQIHGLTLPWQQHEQ